MEGLKTIITRIKPDGKFGGNDYVRGRISGFQSAILSRPSSANIRAKDGSTILKAEGTEEEIERYKILVVEHYPDQCEFLIN